VVDEVVEGSRQGVEGREEGGVVVARRIGDEVDEWLSFLRSFCDSLDVGDGSAASEGARVDGEEGKRGLEEEASPAMIERRSVLQRKKETRPSVSSRALLSLSTQRRNTHLSASTALDFQTGLLLLPPPPPPIINELAKPFANASSTSSSIANSPSSTSSPPT